MGHDDAVTAARYMAERLGPREKIARSFLEQLFLQPDD
jgi:hypothetical protein